MCVPSLSMVSDIEHIFILSYYCDDEVQVYFEIANIWEELTETKVPYSFLLCSRFDYPPSEKLKQRFSKIAPTEIFQSTTEGKGICVPDPGYDVEGPSAMFWDALKFVNNAYKLDGGFVFWFEADMVPLKRDWIDQLHHEWKKSDFDILGVLVDKEWGKKYYPHGAFSEEMIHINGGSCYRKDFIAKVNLNEINMRVSWDIALSDYFLNGRLNFQRTELIEFYYRRQSFDMQLGDKTVLLHGVKDGSAREYVMKNLTLKIKA